MKAFLSLTVVVIAVIAGARAPEAAFLRGQVTIDGDVVRLGDLFAEAGKRADMVVASAPAPGRRSVLGAEELSEIARRAGIDWRPVSRYERVIVHRSARMITTAEIQDKIRTALMAKGLPHTRRISLSNPDLVLYASADLAQSVRVASARLDLRAGRFAAVFEVPTGATSVDRVPVTGQVFEVADVPVLARRMRRGEVIRASDLTTVEMRRDVIARDAIVDAKEIIGQTPKRFMRDGVPLRPGDLRPPVLVTKGSLTTLVLRTDRMVITARGKALDNGARGEVVRVINLRSRHTVEGVVAGPGEVMIVLPAEASARLIRAE